MIEKNGTNGGVRGPFLSIVEGDDGNGVSRKLLLCIKAMHDAHLQPVDVTQFKGDQEDQDVFLLMLEMLRSEEFLSGSNEQAVLTSKGLKSLKAAPALDFRVARFFSEGAAVLDEYDPRELLVSILRAHFDQWQQG